MELEVIILSKINLIRKTCFFLWEEFSLEVCIFFGGGRFEGKMVKGRVEFVLYRNVEEELFREGGDLEGSITVFL